MFVFFILFDTGLVIENFSTILYLMFYMSLFARISIYTASGSIFSVMHSCTTTANEYTYFS